MVAGGEHDAGLDKQIAREGEEGSGDQSQRFPLPGFAGAGQFPEHDCAGADLDQ
jgi:hypothetical protein